MGYAQIRDKGRIVDSNIHRNIREKIESIGKLGHVNADAFDSTTLRKEVISILRLLIQSNDLDPKQLSQDLKAAELI